MRWVLLVLSLSQFAIAWNAAGAERQLREVTIADPYIELHTGPGGGYPIFFVAERGEQIALLMRRTEWFKVRVARGQEGWVHFEQLTTTLNPDGEPFDLPALGFSDYEARRWEAPAASARFGPADARWAETKGGPQSARVAYGLSERSELFVGVTKARRQEAFEPSRDWKDLQDRKRRAYSIGISTRW